MTPLATAALQVTLPPLWSVAAGICASLVSGPVSWFAAARYHRSATLSLCAAFAFGLVSGVIAQAIAVQVYPPFLRADSSVSVAAVGRSDSFFYLGVLLPAVWAAVLAALPLKRKSPA